MKLVFCIALRGCVREVFLDLLYRFGVLLQVGCVYI
jgi:hypothetical protein